MLTEVWGLLWRNLVSLKFRFKSFKEYILFISFFFQSYGFTCTYYQVMFFIFFLGIWLHESGVLGASPDGLIKEPPKTVVHMNDPEADERTPEILEIKCPYSARDTSVQDATSSVKGFFLGNQLICYVPYADRLSSFWVSFSTYRTPSLLFLCKILVVPPIIWSSRSIGRLGLWPYIN